MALPLLALAPAIGGAVSSILDRVLPKKMTEAERAAVELELVKHDWQSVLGQLGINAAEAQHESLFVAGWRPFCGWVCGSALAWTFVVGPMAVWGLATAGVEVSPLPTLDMGTLLPILLGMLGLGSMRTYEKFTGSNRNR